MVAEKYLDENEDQLGKYIRLEWEKYIYYKGRCVFEESGTDGLRGQMLDFEQMNTGEENTFCKYNIYF